MSRDVCVCVCVSTRVFFVGSKVCVLLGSVCALLYDAALFLDYGSGLCVFDAPVRLCELESVSRSRVSKLSARLRGCKGRRSGVADCKLQVLEQPESDGIWEFVVCGSDANSVWLLLLYLRILVKI